MWELTSPDGAETLKIIQTAGDILWLPPGWRHAVRTCAEGVPGPVTGVASHWTTWVLPRCLAVNAALAYTAGNVVESQASTGARKDGRNFLERRGLAALVTQYVQGR